jgi:hypothetical protein
MTTTRIDRGEHPTDVNLPTEPLSLTEQRVFGDTSRCPQTGIPYECGSGALSREEQSRLYVRKVEIERQRRLTRERQEAADRAELQRGAELLASLKARMVRG